MATTDMQRLIVSLEARTKAFENAMNKANGVANARARAIESRFAKMNNHVGAGFAALGSKMAAAFAVAGGLKGAQDLVDSAIKIENALKVAGLAGEDLKRVYDQLFASAQKNSAPIEDLVTLYSRASLSAGELGVSQERLLKFTDGVGVALRVAGTDAAAASGALLQLSQALGAGTVRAEEFNSIQEGALPILQAVANGITEAGGSVAKLRKLVIDGKISSKAFFDGFEAGAGALDEKVAGSTSTVAQQFIRLRNVLIDAAGDFNKGSKAAEAFGGFLDDVTAAIAATDFSKMGEEIANYIGWVNDAIKAVNNWLTVHGLATAEATGLDVIGEGIATGAQAIGLGGVVTSDRILRKRMGAIGLLGGTAPQVPSALGPLTADAVANYGKARIPGGGGPVVTAPKAPRIVAPPPVVDPISIKDPRYATKGDGKGKKAKKDEYVREVEQIRERTLAMQAETAAQAGINPLVNDYGFAVTKATTARELLAAAEKAGIAITPELTASIDDLATGYANASVEADKLAESQDRAREIAQEFADLGKDVMGGFVRDLMEGKSATEALAGALQKVADKLLDVALNAVFGGGSMGGGLFGGLLGGMGGGGGIGGMIGKLFGFRDGGVARNGMPVSGGRPLKRFARGGVSDTAAIFGEAGAEAAVPLPDGRTIPVTLSAPRVPQGRGGHETIRVVLQDDSGRMAEIADQRVQSAAGTIIQVSVQQSTKAVRQQLPGMLPSAQARSL